MEVSFSELLLYMTSRLASIDNINRKYRGSSGIIPAGGQVTQVIAPSPIRTGTLRRSVVVQPTTIVQEQRRVVAPTSIVRPPVSGILTSGVSPIIRPTNVVLPGAGAIHTTTIRNDLQPIQTSLVGHVNDSRDIGLVHENNIPVAETVAVVNREPRSGIEGRKVFTRSSSCPWWCWLLIGLLSLLFLGGIIAACCGGQRNN